MTSYSRETLTIQMDSDLLASVRNLAETEGKPVQSLIDEALAELIKQRRQDKPRAHAMAAYQGSHLSFGQLYKKLAE